MPPKLDKNRTDDTYWRSYLEETPLNEESWQIKVILFETAGSEQEITYLNRFETYAKEEKRFVIKNICKSETIFMINQLGAEKRVRDESLRVFEEGYLFLKDKRVIPPDVLALIIKHLILNMKEEYISIQRQKLVVREGIRKESLTMIDRMEIKNNLQFHDSEPTQHLDAPQIKSKTKKAEGDAQSNPLQPDEGKKYSTLLRERGEEWRDKVYVDDYPLDGPNLYLAITGFLEPYLLENLIKIGVPLTALVQIRIDPTLNKISSSALSGTKRGHSISEVAAEKAHMFWENLQQLRINKNSAEAYKDMAFIVFNPQSYTKDTLLTNSEKIYDELSYLMYDIQDLTRQHYHYLNNMDITCIPTKSENNSLLPFYLNRIDCIPLECVTIFSIIDIMLQTVCADYTDHGKSSKTSLSSAVTFLQQNKSVMSHSNLEKAETLVDKVFTALSKNDLNKKKYRLTCGDEYDNFQDPIIMNYGDCAKHKNFYLENVNFDYVILSSLVHMPLCNLWKNQKILSDVLKAKVNFHVNTLLSCFDREDLDDSLLNRLIHILSFRKLYNNRSSLKKKIVALSTISEFKKMYLKRSMSAEPLLKCASLFWSSSATSPPSPFMVRSECYSKELGNKTETEEQSIKFLYDCPDLSELVSAEEIVSGQPLSHFMDNFDYFEDFTAINALQTLFDVFGKFNCLNYKYCEVTDSYVIMFFNDHDGDGISRNEWRCHLPTPVCLQDFFDFVLEEQCEWVQNEERIYDEIAALRAKLEWKESLEQVPPKTCIENIDEIDSDLLITGSLKYQERTRNDNVYNEENDQNQFLGKSTPISPAFTELDTKSSQKSKSSRSQETKKKIKETITEVNIDAVSETNQYIKPFNGYNLGNRRIEIFGRDSFFFSKDGTKVSSYYTYIIPMNREHLIANVTSGNNEFYMQKTLGDTASSDYESNSQSFRIGCKNQVIMYLKKNYYQKALSAVSMPPLTKHNAKEPLNKINVKRSSSINTQTVNIFYNSFIITWPNGLIIESIHENNSSVISHIKQSFITSKPCVDEDMRCITLDGEVIVFKKSNDLEIFRPDGTFIKITKCGKKAINPVVSEDAQSDTRSNKVKKGKGNKSKDKLGRAGSTSSKITLGQNQIEIPLQYMFVIDEFERIDGNGLKEKWINDHLICSEKVLIRTAVDYCLGEVLSRRMDGTTLLINKDGIQIFTFHDNTRIITTYYIEDEEIYAELIESNVSLSKSNDFETNRASKTSLTQKSVVNSCMSLGSSTWKKNMDAEKKTLDGFVSVQIIHTIEHSNFATVVIDKAKGSITVESANKACLTVDSANNYSFSLDESTSANFDGEYLNIIFKTCHLCHSSTKSQIKINNTKSCHDINKFWLTMKDSFGKNIVIDNEGAISLTEESCKSEMNHKKKEMGTENLLETCLTLEGNCRNLYEANMYRFFVLNRDLTCSELIHRILIDQYKTQCRWQPWCSINQYNTFGDERTLLSILTPIELNETEKWLMRSKYSNKPKRLKYKDLKEDTGKGFYHWMRPYERFQPKPTEIENTELPQLPRAYVLRTLEQLWNEEMREKLKGGKEIIKAVLRYRRLLESESQTILSVPIKDPRTKDEKVADVKLQDIAHRVYNHLKNEIADDIQARAKLKITTKILSPRLKSFPEDGEGNQLTCDELKKNWEEKSAAYVREVEEAEEPSPSYKRYWRRRAEEAREEEFYKQLLREESIPPYFRNILGGAAWCEVNQAAGDAVSRTEADPCPCVTPDTKPETLKEFLTPEDCE